MNCLYTYISTIALFIISEAGEGLFSQFLKERFVYTKVLGMTDETKLIFGIHYTT